MIRAIAQKPIRWPSRGLTPLRRSAKEIQTALRKTAGLWRGRSINPLTYQRAMRKTYATVRKRPT